MTTPVCPTCQQSAIRLLDISKDAWVNYFSCDSCHHTWNVPKTPVERGLPQDQVKRIGRITYERRYVIVHVPAEWRFRDPLPDPSPEDRWFDKLADFEAVLGAPWDREAINRQPFDAEKPAHPPAPAKDRRK